MNPEKFYEKQEEKKRNARGQKFHIKRFELKVPLYWISKTKSPKYLTLLTKL